MAEMKVAKRKKGKINSTDLNLLVESTTQEEIFEYDKNRIIHTLQEEIDCPNDIAIKVADIVTERLNATNTKILTPSLIRSFVNVVLCEYGFDKQLKSNSEITISTNDVESLIFNKNKENGNTPHNPESINLALAGLVIKQYTLKKILPKHLRQAHLQGDIHIHDMDMYDRLYCSGHNPEYIKRNGIKNMDNIPNDSKPANSAWVVARHMASATLFYTSLFAGAIGWDSVNMFLAPYTRGWDYKKYKQLAQTLIFDFAQLAGAKGGQVSFTDFNIYANVPQFYKDTYAVGKNGCYMVEDSDDIIHYIYNKSEAELFAQENNYKILTYKDFETESQYICKALLEVSKEGDSRGMPFGFPKLHFHINNEVFEHESSKELYKYACEVLSLQGNPYIDFDRNAASMSQCCRLVIEFDNSDMELTKTPEELRFVGGENVSINLPNIPLMCSNDEVKIFAEIKRRIDMAVEAHKIKLEYIKSIVEVEGSPLKFYKEGCDEKPYVRFDKISWLIGMVGLNECIYNLTGKQLHESKSAYIKGLEIISFMNQYCKELSKKHNMKFILEETPAESTAGRFAKLDRKKYGDKTFVKENDYGFYYSNSIHFAVDAKIDYIDELQYQSKFHSLVEAGSMIHVWVGDKRPSPKAISDLIYKVWKNTKCTEMTISPNKTVCNNCKTTVDGFHDFCPKCNNTNVFWIARITGYQVRVDKFNASKLAELFDRNNHDIENDNLSINFLENDVPETNDIKIYSLPNCPNCRKIKTYCKTNDIIFTEFNTENDFKARARIIAEGLENFPIIQLGNKFIEYDFNKDSEIKEIIKEYNNCLNQ
jgi:anaerobic ribonucleoside-triphosphate reductase